MTDDIVTRLRWFTCEELNCESDVICSEAADEIERLRAVIQWFEHTQTCPNYGLRNCWRCVTPANQKSIMKAMFD
jgi:hypothetical protein